MAILWVFAFAKLPFLLRTYGLLLISLTMVIWSMLLTGMAADAGIFMILFVIYTFMFLGVRSGVIAILLNIGLMFGLGWGITTQQIAVSYPMIDALSQGSWLIIGSETIFIVVVIVIGVVTLQNALTSALLREQDALEEVSLERALLEERVIERTKDLEQAYQQLQANQEALLVSEKMASLGRLTAGIAHEMNTPLAAVRAALYELDMLVDEFGKTISDVKVSVQDRLEINEEMRQAVGISKRSITRIMKFIRGIKSQTRQLDEGEHQRFNAMKVIEDTLMLFGHSLIRNNCKVSFVPQMEIMELVGSATSFGQIVSNLITNAIDASIPRGGGLITVELLREGDSLRLEVSDEGVGIPTEIRSKIFDPMFTTKPFGEGTGLGLSIVYDLVTEGFQGAIDFTSQVGEGSTFTVHFPNIE
ncbi:MAG: hypothetical protein ISR58_13030 [Anaerolineales bacterium]|nr:hypothetical protein [Chloroflexota bacterium]MBL6982100.1 hypothetical protein [Anaerolineales bacterium]